MYYDKITHMYHDGPTIHLVELTHFLKHLVVSTLSSLAISASVPSSPHFRHLSSRINEPNLIFSTEELHPVFHSVKLILFDNYHKPLVLPNFVPFLMRS